jgi:ATP-dependent Clp protease adaptor protein ClpS
VSGSHEASGPSLDVRERTELDEDVRAKILPPFNVVLLDDDDHTYAYVIEMLRTLFGTQEERAWQLANEVNGSGRAIVCTTSKERAELKRDQIHAYGPDPRMKTSAGSMSSVIEPCPR